jgi:hypothetical protein
MIKFRDTNESDIPQLIEWSSKDSCPFHRDVDPKFWLPEEHAKCFAIEDEKGVVYYLRLENVMRCHIQFPPDDVRDKGRTALALKQAFVVVAAGAKKLGYKEFIFTSVSEGLIRLFKKFGFQKSENEFSARL